MSGFSTITIEEATERLIDYRGKTPPKTDSGIRLITAKVVKGGQILDEPAEYISPDLYDSWMRRGLPQKNDVLLTTEAPLGEVAMLRTGEQIALAQRIILLRAKEAVVDPMFLFYSLQSDFGQGELKARSTGTTVLGIKQSELRQARVPLFPLERQRKISSLLSAYDDLIANSQQRMGLLEKIARLLYREWFIDFRYEGHGKHRRFASSLGEIPQGWEVVTLGTQLSSLETGKRPKGGVREEKDGVPSIGAENINGLGHHDFSKEKFVPLSFFQQMRRGIVRDRDVAIYKDGAYIGKSSYFRDGFPHTECCVNEHVFLLRANGRRLTQNLLYLWLQEPSTVATIRATNTNSAQPGINQQSLSSVQLLLPDEATSKRFDDFVDPLLAQIITLSKQIRNLRQTRNLLLPPLLSGTISL